MNDLDKDGKGVKDKELKDREAGAGPGRRKTVRKGMFAKDRKLLSYYYFFIPSIILIYTSYILYRLYSSETIDVWIWGCS